jgi:hypothetical protein
MFVLAAVAVERKFSADEEQAFARAGLTSADRARLRDFIVQREGATPAAAARVAGSEWAQEMMEGARSFPSPRARACGARQRELARMHATTHPGERPRPRPRPAPHHHPRPVPPQARVGRGGGGSGRRRQRRRAGS